jgi:hypothetical protein
MASPAQIQANRLNAQRSTGPRSDDGKAASRFNALKYGIEARSLEIPGEDPAELEALALEYRQQFNADGPLEGFLVETLVQADWNRRRYTRIEAHFLQVLIAGKDAADPTRLGAFVAPQAQQIFRRLAATERSYFRALKELRRIQKERKAQEENSCVEPAEVLGPAPVPPVEPPIGFVLPIRVQPALQPARPAEAAHSTPARPSSSLA